MPASALLPQLTIDDPGNAVNGTLFGGPFTGPLAIEEMGAQTFIVLDKNVQLVDAVARTVAGAALAQDHALLVAVGQINNVVGILRSGDLTPGSAQRHCPALRLPSGPMIQFRSVQLSGAIEVARWTLYFA